MRKTRPHDACGRPRLAGLHTHRRRRAPAHARSSQSRSPLRAHGAGVQLGLLPTIVLPARWTGSHRGDTCGSTWWSPTSTSRTSSRPHSGETVSDRTVSRGVPGTERSQAAGKTPTQEDAAEIAAQDRPVATRGPLRREPPSPNLLAPFRAPDSRCSRLRSARPRSPAQRDRCVECPTR